MGKKEDMKYLVKYPYLIYYSYGQQSVPFPIVFVCFYFLIKDLIWKGYHIGKYKHWIKKIIVLSHRWSYELIGCFALNEFLVWKIF